MITTVCQRWRTRRDSYRPVGEPIDTSKYEVALVEYADAKTFVKTHHYSGRFSSALCCVGLWRRGALVGVAVFGNSASERAMQAALPFDVARAELTRFVLLDDVPANGETWFLRRAFALARRRNGFDAVVAYADPVPRRNAAGLVIHPGHVGVIYQAYSGVFTGQTKTRTKYRLPDGGVLTDRELSKVRAEQSGMGAVLRRLEAFGVGEPKGEHDWKRWRFGALAEVLTTFRHPGTYRYIWPLSKPLRRHFPISQPYPKFVLTLPSQAAR